MADTRPECNLAKAVWLIAIIGIGTVLYLAQDVFIPVAMALFLALLLTPAVDRLQRWGLRRGLAVLVVLFVVLAAVASALNAAWGPATEWLTRAPQTMRKIDPRLQPLRDVFARVDAGAERAGRLTQGSVPASDKPVAVALDTPNTAITLTKSLLE